MKIGQRLKEARSISQLKQDTVARHLGISRQTLSNWENGHSYPDIASVVRLSELYGISVEELVREGRGEDHLSFLEKHWEHFYGAAVISLPLSVMLSHYGFRLLAIAVWAAGILLFCVPRILFYRLFYCGIKNILPGILGWLMAAFGFSALMDFEYRSMLQPLLVTVGTGLILHTRKRESPLGQTRRGAAVRWIAHGIILLCPIMLMLSSAGAAGQFNANTPFDHIYYAEQIIYDRTQPSRPPLVRLSSGNILYLDDKRIGKFHMTQSLSEAQAEEFDELWQLTPEDFGRDLYRLAVEKGGPVTLAYLKDDVLQWKYLLGRVDTISCSISSDGQNTYIELPWYYENSADQASALPHYATILTGGTITFLPQDKTDTLVVMEEYYSDGSLTCYTHTLVPNSSGNLTLSVSPRYHTQDQYAVYRIPFQTGEYVFSIRFS